MERQRIENLADAIDTATLLGMVDVVDELIEATADSETPEPKDE